MVPLTLVIIAKDEADRIGRAIRSVPCAAEVVVLDSGSMDDTVAVARAMGARVIETDWPGFGPQKTRAWEAATQPWVLSLDADEWLDPEAAAAIEACVRADQAGVFRLRRHNRWCGRRIRGGAWGPSLKLRLARQGDACWSAAQVHEVLESEQVVSTLAGRLEHDPFREPAEHLAQLAAYATLFVVESRRIGRSRSALALLTRPFLHIVKALLLRGGWRDGGLGLLLAWTGAAGVALKWAMLWLDEGKGAAGTGLASFPD